MSYVYLVHRVIRYESDDVIDVKASLPAARRAAQTHADDNDSNYDRKPRKIRWTRPKSAPNCWNSDTRSSDTHYSIVKWKVTG